MSEQTVPYRCDSTGWRDRLAQARGLILEAEAALAAGDRSALVQAWRPIVREVLELCSGESDGGDPLERERRHAARLKSLVRWLPLFAVQAAHDEAPRAGAELLSGARQ